MMLGPVASLCAAKNGTVYAILDSGIYRSPDGATKWEHEIGGISGIKFSQVIAALDGRLYAWSPDSGLYRLGAGMSSVGRGILPELFIGIPQPNPVTTDFSIEVRLAEAQVITAQVVDAMGRVVRNQTDYLPAGSSTLSTNLRGLPSGAYHCDYRSGQLSATRTIVLMK